MPSKHLKTDSFYWCMTFSLNNKPLLKIYFVRSKPLQENSNAHNSENHLHRTNFWVSFLSSFDIRNFECFNSNAIVFECFEIFNIVWIQLLVADAIKMATERMHHEVLWKVKREALKELEKGRPNKDIAKQFIIPGSILATWKKTKKKSLKLFKIHHWNDKEWKL